MFRQTSSLGFASTALGFILILFTSLPSIGFASDGEKGLFYYVIDRSGSITAYGLTEPIRRAITDHASQLPEETEVRLVFFSRRASDSERWDFTTAGAKTDFAAHFRENFIPDGPTRLYDTVGEVLEEIRASEEDYRFVSVLVFSDGENNWSRQFRSWQELEPAYRGLVSRHEQSFIYWITLEFEPEETPPDWVIHEPQPPGTRDIPIPEPMPVADFRANPQQLKVGEPIQFEHVARGGRVTEIGWDFGDGNESSEENPIHHYERDGTYTVTLRTVGPGGESEEVKEDFIQVAPVIPLTARFRVGSERHRIGDTIELRDQSEGNPEEWRWRLAGETFSTEANTSIKAQAAGDLSISLTVRRGEETDTVTQSITVLPPPPGAAFTISPEEATFGETVVFAADETQRGWAHRWTIDSETTMEGDRVEWVSDRHGLLHVVHTVEGPGGFSRHADRVFVHPPVEVVPSTAFSIQPRVFVEGDTVTFSARETDEGRLHAWYVDEERVGEGPVFQWESDRRGNIVVTHRVELADSDAVFDSSDEMMGREPELVRVMLSASRSSGTFPLTVEFLDQSEGEGVAYRWDFGDGNFSTQRNPTHTYEEAGDYTVVLAVTNRLGETTTNTEPMVLSVVPPMPLWQKAVIGLLIGLVVWVIFIVPLVLRPLLAPQKGPKLVGIKTYPLHMSARQGWSKYFWPKNSVTIGSALTSDIRLPNGESTRGDVALIERSPAAASYSIRPVAGNEIFKIEKPTSLMHPDAEEKSKVGRGRVLRDGDTYEVAGERLTWCQPRKRPARATSKKKRSTVTNGKLSFAKDTRKHALAKVKN